MGEEEERRLGDAAGEHEGGLTGCSWRGRGMADGEEMEEKV